MAKPLEKPGIFNEESRMARSATSIKTAEDAPVQQTDGRRRLLAGAAQVFRQSGYVSASVDDIARAAGVSRQTFYRHFDGKLAIAIEFFKARRDEAMPLWDGLTESIAADPAAAKAWLLDYMAYQRDHKLDLRALFELGVFEPAFLIHANGLVPQIVDTLAGRVAAFAVTSGDSPEARLLRAEAVLLIYQILDQSTNAAMGFCLLEEPLLAEVLARALVGFVLRNTPAQPRRAAQRRA
jgi:AcrR family transcriptional regulator